MNLDKLLEKENLCINDYPAPCTSICPIHVDVKGFINEIQKNNFQKAYNILAKKMPMIGIISRVCDHPCEQHCIRKDFGGSITINLLERAVLKYGEGKKKKGLPIPKNNKEVAIIGGGISGMTCAIDLKKKGYSITIYEKEESIGGRFRNMIGEKLPKEVLENEIENIKKMGVKIIKNKFISKEDVIELKEKYNAIYIGTGSWEEDIDFNSLTLESKEAGIFLGGQIVTKNKSIIHSVSTGRIAGISIDRYTQNTSLTASRKDEGSYKTQLLVDTSDVSFQSKTLEKSNLMTREEALEESKRCILCECGRCYKACPHLRDEKLYPKAYIRTINQNERVLMGDRYANKTINSCMLCGLCGAVCPTDLNMAEIIRDTRKSMVQREKMPVSAHDFALKDMEFNMSQYFNLLKNEPNLENSSYLFFPGCQLSSSYSEYVKESYNYLRNNLDGGVGLYLNCCGAPGEWAGRMDLFKNSLDKILKDWENMNKPIIILACSTCYHIFNKYLPEIQIITLWEIINKKGLVKDRKRYKKLVVHDSCTARDYSNIYDSIRSIMKTLEVEIIEPKYTKEHTQCCGYGGFSYFANKEFSEKAIKERIALEDEDYLVYCAMCRDLFASKGKKTLHILDLIFGEDLEVLSKKKGPTLSERRDNRFRLKKDILNELWGEKMNIQEEYSNIDLILSEEIIKKIDDRLILEADIRKVIGLAEKNNNMFINKENNHRLASRRLVNLTYWVEYFPVANAYEVVSAYSHRMDVQGE